MLWRVLSLALTAAVMVAVTAQAAPFDGERNCFAQREQLSGAPGRAPSLAQARVRSDLSGSWQGLYLYPGDSRTVPFTLTLRREGGRYRGRSSEPNTFGDRSAAELFANIDASTEGEDGVRFDKRYDGTGGASHLVVYRGRFTDATTVEGTWTIPGSGQGRFCMRWQGP